MIMTTSPVTCIHGSEIDRTQLGVLLNALAASDETALTDTSYFDESWTADVPNVPRPSDDRDDPDDPPAGSNKGRKPLYPRVVAVKDGAYVGFLAGRFDAKSAFIAVAAALHPGSGDGVGPKLLDKFATLAIAEGRTQLRLFPDSGGNYEDRIRFFKGQGFEWCTGGAMCKPLVDAITPTAH